MGVNLPVQSAGVTVCMRVCVRNGNRIRGAVGGGLDRGVKTLLIPLEKAETDVKEQEKSVEKKAGEKMMSL